MAHDHKVRRSAAGTLLGQGDGPSRPSAFVPAAADASGAQPSSVQLPVVAPPPDDPALMATAPAPVPEHRITTIGPYELSQLSLAEVTELFERATDKECAEMRYYALVGLTTLKQQGAVPERFFARATNLYEGVPEQERNLSPGWIRRRMGAIGARSPETQIAADRRVVARAPGVQQSVKNKRRERVILVLVVIAILLATVILLVALGVLKNPFNS